MGNMMPSIIIEDKKIKITTNDDSDKDYSKKEAFLNEHTYYICNVNNLFIIAISFLLYKNITKELFKDTCKDIIPNNEMVDKDKIEMDGRQVQLTNIDPSVIPIVRNAIHHFSVRFNNQQDKTIINPMFSLIMFLGLFMQLKRTDQQEQNYNVVISKGIINDPSKFIDIFFEIAPPTNEEKEKKFNMIKEKYVKYIDTIKKTTVSDEIKLANAVKFILIIMTLMSIYTAPCDIDYDKIKAYLDNYIEKDIDKTSKIYSNYIVLQSISSNKYEDTEIVVDTPPPSSSKKPEDTTITISGNLFCACYCCCCSILCALVIYALVKLLSNK